MKKNIYLFLASIALISLSSCKDTSLDALETSFASFTTETLAVGLESGTETSKEVKIYTTNITGSDRSIPVEVVAESTDAEEGAYTLPATVTIPSGSNVGILTIGIKDVGLSLSTDKFLVIRLKSSDQMSTGPSLKIGISQLCPNNGIKIKINLDFDKWPEEVAWRIKDASGNTVLASSTPLAYGAYADPKYKKGSISITDCLSSGTYTIQIYDKYKDGGTSYKVTANGVQIFTASGDYGAGTSASFTI